MTAPQIPEYSAFIPAICFGPDNQILVKPFLLKPCRHRVSESDLHKYERACYCGSIISKSKPDLELQGIISVCLQNRTVVDKLVRQVKSKDEEMVAYKAQVQPRLEKLQNLEKRALGALNLQPKPKALPAKTETEPAKESVPQTPAESLKATAAPSIPNPQNPPYEPLPSEITVGKVVESIPVVPRAIETTAEKPTAEVLEKDNQVPSMMPMAMEVIATANNTIHVDAPAIPAQLEAANVSIKITLKKQAAKRPSEDTCAVSTPAEKQIPTISQQALPLILPTFPKKPKAKAMAKANNISNEIAESDEPSPITQKKRGSTLFKGRQQPPNLRRVPTVAQKLILFPRKECLFLKNPPRPQFHRRQLLKPNLLPTQYPCIPPLL